MKTIVSEFPKHPLPHVPQPPEPSRTQIQPPTVFVYEKQSWEYKVVSREHANDSMLSEAELNALGKDGWELTGIVSLPNSVQFYLKRIRT
jgi:uncharacterized protein DUF4177